MLNPLRFRLWTPLLILLTIGLTLTVGVAGQEGDHDDDHDHAGDTGLTDYDPDFRFILRTALVDGGFAFIGVGGDIDGQVNPTLEVAHDAIVEITLINGDGIEHDIDVAEFGAMSGHVTEVWETTVLAFRAEHEGTLNYVCTVPGHAEAGMTGHLAVGEGHGDEGHEEDHD